MKLEPLYPALFKAVEHIVDVLMPDGFDTTDNEEHCNTYRKLEGYYKATGGRIIVWTGASDRTIFGDPAVNHAFRAWHDWCHLVLEADFSQDGEHKVCLMQQRQVRTMCEDILTKEEIAEACKFIECEIDGQKIYTTQSTRSSLKISVHLRQRG